MGLALCLRRVDATDLQRLLKSPGDVYRFLLGKDPPEPKAGPSKFRWIPFSEIPPEPAERQKAWREGLEIDLDKVWHVIHFLLTGSAGKVNAPEGSLLADDRPIGDCEVGASRAWALLPEETARFAGAIAPVRIDDIKRRFDVEAMRREDVYLARAMEDDPSCHNEVWRNLAKLQNFLAAASANGQGIVLFMV